MISDLPGSSQIKKLTGVLNSQYDIKKCPNSIIGVQQSIKLRIVQCLTHFVKQASTKALSIPETFRIKITGDGTQIAQSFNIVNIVFTILEEKCKECSVFRNHSVAILKIIENYEELASGLQDICKEAADLQVVSIQGKYLQHNILCRRRLEIFSKPFVAQNQLVLSIHVYGANAPNHKEQIHL